MKKTLLILLLSAINISAQQDYKLIEKIQYYSSEVANSDDYINERCVLDVYFPTNKKEFATIVWFHGGGLRTGEKEIPESLKEKGVGIIGVNYRLYPNISAPAYIEDAAAAVAWVF